MKANPRELAIALAGVFQAVKLVQQTASGGGCDHAALDTCITGIFNTRPVNPESVFGPLPGLRLGLETALQQIGGPRAARDTALTRYAITVFYLQRKLHRNNILLEKIGQGINKAREQADFFNTTHPNVLASLAECYRDTVSTLRPRIMVSGDQNVLGNPDTQHLIRTLLLAAIRAAVLWRQCGGGRLTLVLQRKSLLAATDTLLQEARRLH